MSWSEYKSQRENTGGNSWQDYKNNRQEGIIAPLSKKKKKETIIAPIRNTMRDSVSSTILNGYDKYKELQEKNEEERKKYEDDINNKKKTLLNMTEEERLEYLKNAQKEKNNIPLLSTDSLGNLTQVGTAVKMSDKANSQNEGDRIAANIRYALDRGKAGIKNSIANTFQYLENQTAGDYKKYANPDSNSLTGKLIRKFSTEEELEKARKDYNENIKPKYVDRAVENSKKLMSNANANRLYAQTNLTKGQNFIGDVAEQIGGQLPTIALSAVNPALGDLGMYMSSAGQESSSLLSNGTDINKANTVGGLKGLVEVGTEKIFGGIKFRKGVLDDVVGNTIANKAKTKIGNFLLTKGYQVLGENSEELISNVAGYAIDKLFLDKNTSLKEMWEDAKETVKMTTATTLGLNLIGLGGENFSENKSVNDTIVSNYEKIVSKKLNDDEKTTLIKSLDKIRTEINNQNNELTDKQQKLNAQEELQNKTTSNEENIMQNEQKMIQNENISENVEENESNYKQKQFDIINKSNPMTDDYHTGIRSVNDIKTFEEAMKDSESFVYGDFDINDAQKALENGKVTVYSSKPIEQGGFVSTSQNMAKDYAGNGKIYSKKVNLEDVAWLNGDEGQYAKVENTQNEEVTKKLNRNGTFSEQIDKYMSGKLPSGDFLYLGKTPSILQKVGLPNNEIILKQGKLNDIMKESKNDTDNLHGISIDNIKKIPEAISNPLNILQSSSDKNSIVVITDLADKYERPIIVSVEMNYDGQIGKIKFVSNRVTSAYGKRDYDRFMNEEIGKGNLLYDIDEGIIKELPATRLQLSKGISSSVDTNNNVSTSNISITPSNENVNNTTANIIMQNNKNYSQNNQMPNNNIEIPKIDITDLKSKRTIADRLTNKSTKLYKDTKTQYKNFIKDELKNSLPISDRQANIIYNTLSKDSTIDEIKETFNKYRNSKIEVPDSFKAEVNNAKEYLRNTQINVSSLNGQITDLSSLKKQIGKKLNLSMTEGLDIDTAYKELSNTFPQFFNVEKENIADQFLTMADFVNYQAKQMLEPSTIKMSDEEINVAVDKIKNYLEESDKQLDLAYKTLQENDMLGKPITHKEVKEYLSKKMGINFDDIAVGNDIANLNFQITDPIRTNEKVFGRKVGQKINDATVNPMKHNEANRTRWLNNEKTEIKDLGIKARSKESAAVQKYGEKQYVAKDGTVIPYNDFTLEKEFSDVKTREKIKNAARVIRNKYDNYIDLINEVITSYGYDAIPKRADYMRHFQELTDVFSKTGVPFNLNDMKSEDLPTDINGLTAMNKPGKNWFASSQKRYGDITTYDAITGIDGYLEGASNLIFHTGDIQNYRALSQQIRDTYGESKGFDNLNNLSEEEALQRIKDIQSNKLSKYAAWLDEQANALAGKKGDIDRGFERVLGRKGYTLFNTLKKQTGSNMVGFNARSALTNFISTTIASAKTNKIAMAKGTISTINNMFHNDGFINKSDFLTTRFGSDQLSQKVWSKISNAGQILMTGSDYLTANIITRSKYYEGLQKGMSESKAIKYADDFAARVMGDRSKGTAPEIFNSKSLGLLTQFQLETNNQWQYMIHDTKMEFQDLRDTKGGLRAGATVLFQLGQLAAFSYLFNEGFEKLTGSRAAFDPLEILKKLFGIDKEDEDKDFEARMKEAGSLLADSLPLASLFSSGGRLPIGESVKGITTGIKYALGGKNDYGQEVSLKDLKEDTLGSLGYILLPTGYSQGKKIVQGIKTVSEGGAYSKDGTKLQFPVDKTVGNYIKGATFGKYALPNAQTYIDRGFKALSKNQTQTLKYSGLKYEEYLDYLDNTDTTKKSKVNYINKSKLSTNQKWKLYMSDIFTSDKQKDKARTAIASGTVTKEQYMKQYTNSLKED